MSTESSVFLSIFLATCRPHNIPHFLDNLAATAHDPKSFEILIKLDEGADDLINLIENYKKTSLLIIKYLATAKLDGYYSFHVGYDALLEIADKNTYFCWLLTDEIRLQTPGWDQALAKYIKFYPDDIFRLKLSIFQLKNYLDLYDCLPCPDNYAVTTRKWLQITGGWGNFWGPDSWHQCIDFYLSLCKNSLHELGIWRSIPVFGITVAGQEAGLGKQTRKQRERCTIRISQGWREHSTHRAQENYFRLAQHLNAHIYAHACNLNHFTIRDNPRSKLLSLVDDNHHYHGIWSYRLPKFKIQLISGYKILTLRRLLRYLYIQSRRYANLILISPSQWFKKLRLNYEIRHRLDAHSKTHYFLRRIEHYLLLPNLYVRLFERRARNAFKNYRLQKKIAHARASQIAAQSDTMDKTS